MRTQECLTDSYLYYSAAGTCSSSFCSSGFQAVGFSPASSAAFSIRSVPFDSSAARSNTSFLIP